MNRKIIYILVFLCSILILCVSLYFKKTYAKLVNTSVIDTSYTIIVKGFDKNYYTIQVSKENFINIKDKGYAFVVYNELKESLFNDKKCTLNPLFYRDIKE